jgi:hypothetical protein
MTKRVTIENASCDYCEKEIAPGHLALSGKDHKAVEEFTGDVLAKDDDKFESDSCEDCYWRLKNFIQEGLKNQQLKRRALSTNNKHNSSVFLAHSPL